MAKEAKMTYSKKIPFAKRESGRDRRTERRNARIQKHMFLNHALKGA